MRFFIVVVVVFIVCGCKKNVNYYSDGLTSLRNHRVINESFLKGFKVEKFGIIKSEKNKDEYSFVFLLNKDADSTLVEKYRLGVRCYLDKENRTLLGEEDRKKIHLDFPPVIIEKYGRKYLVNSVNLPIKKIDSIIFYLYDRDDYKGRTYGSHINLKNIKL